MKHNNFIQMLLVAFLLVAQSTSAIVQAQPKPTLGQQMGVFVDLRSDKTAADIKDLGLGWVRIMYA